jgi:hypothetical protein
MANLFPDRSSSSRIPASAKHEFISLRSFFELWGGPEQHVHFLEIAITYGDLYVTSRSVQSTASGPLSALHQLIAGRS